MFSPHEPSLVDRIRVASDAALSDGSLRPIRTKESLVEQDGVGFSLRRFDSDATCDRRHVDGAGSINPFLPYDERLWVADLSSTHVCLLNKYPVVEGHVLSVTRKFVEQEQLLEVEDFYGAVRCLRELEGLVFYNAGREAGASQRHRHMQLAPFPLASSGATFPTSCLADPILGRMRWPIVHRLAPWRMDGLELEDAAEQAHSMYMGLLSAAQLQVGPGPYNLLMTREWMLVIPRRTESWSGVSINALGFAGCFLFPDDGKAQVAREFGVMRILEHVGFSERAHE